MVKFLLGVITGVLVTWLVIATFEDRLVVREESGNRPGTHEPDVRTQQQSPTGTPSTSDNGTATELPDQVEPAIAAVVAPEDSASQSDPSGSKYNQPINIPNLHRPLLERTVTYRGELTNIGKMHEDLESEEEDPSWAHYMETQIRQTMAKHPSISQFQILNVECRASLCEVQAFGYGENAGSAWSSLLESMRAQPWSSEIKRISGTAIRRSDRRVILTFLMRNIES